MIPIIMIIMMINGIMTNGILMLYQWYNNAQLSTFIQSQLSLPILDTLQKMTNSLLVNVDIPIDTKRLKD